MITLILGSMFSEKTTMLISFARKSKLSRKNVVLVKYNADTRYSVDDICSHNDDSIRATYSCDNLTSITSYGNVITADVILIDEGQFFNDLALICDKWADEGKDVIISALNGTYNRTPFANISEIIPKVEKIIHLTSVCSICGKDGHFSHLISNNDTSRANNGILIGGSDQYQALCRRCWIG